MLSGHINATGLVRFKVVKIDRFRKRVLIESWVVNDTDRGPVRRWYKEKDEHHQDIIFRVH